VQEGILNYLAKKGTVADIPAIEVALDGLKSTEARITALNAHAKLSGGKNVTFLIEKIASADEATGKAIARLLLSSTEAGLSMTMGIALTEASSKTKLVLLEVLAQRADKNASWAVLPLLGAPDKAVRAAALKALPNVAQEADFDKLADLLAKAPQDDLKYIQDALTAMLNASPDKTGKIRQLVSRAAQSATSETARYFPVFAKLGGVDALVAVKSHLDKNAGLRGPAIAALADWPNADALPFLTALSRTETHEENFGKAFSGMVRLINASDHTPDQKTLLLKDAFSLARSTAQKRTVLGALQAAGTYQALMFAGKYMDDPELKRAATNAAMNIAMDNAEFIGTDVRNVLQKAIETLSGSESAYLREAIVRHLAEMPEGEGFVSAFNGRDLTGWKGLVEDPIKRAKMSPEELAEKQAVADRTMHENWKVENGELLYDGQGYDNITTVKQYGDFEMLVDWKLENKKSADAGIYLRGTPQVQIWNNASGHEDSPFGSGGLWNNQKNPKLPLQVADNPLEEWNTFKIRMVGEKVWVWLNGVLVVDNVTLENYWNRNQSIFPVEQIELQAHGSRVWYRDIYIKELPRAAHYTLNEAEKAEGFEMLFDGTNLDKWTETAAYAISPENFLRADPDAKSGKNLYTKAEYGDFVFRFEFKLTPGANNGVGIRTPLEGDAAYVGTEIQILDNDAEIYKNLEPYQYHGSAYGIIPARRGALKPIGQWNAQEIRVEGSRIKVTLNGETILDGDLAEAAKNGTPDGKNHPGLHNASGHIGFLGHGSEVFFRNIRVKRI